MKSGSWLCETFATQTSKSCFPTTSATSCCAALVLISTSAPTAFHCSCRICAMRPASVEPAPTEIENFQGAPSFSRTPEEPTFHPAASSSCFALFGSYVYLMVGFLSDPQFHDGRCV